MPTFILDARWNDLLDALAAAALDPADPISALGEIISEFVCPEAARADVERHHLEEPICV